MARDEASDAGPADATSQFLAMVVYRCVVNGEPTGSLDVQVRWFRAKTEAEVAAILKDESLCEYENSDGEQVGWQFVNVMAIEPFAPRASGEEVVGFIAGLDEWHDMAMDGD